MVELCILYGQNEEGMASELIAFCTSTRKDCLTLETLNSFEHEVRRNCRQTNNVNFCVCSVERWSTVLRRVCTLESDLDSSPNVSVDHLLIDS